MQAEGEAEPAITVTDAVVNTPSEMRELPIDKLGTATCGLFSPGPTLVAAGLSPLAGVFFQD